MIVFLPEPTVAECVEFFARPHLFRTAMNCLQVARAIHEQGALADKLQRHPSVLMWRGHETFLCYYGLELIERYLQITDDADYPTKYGEANMIRGLLEEQMSLATTESYTPELPPFMGNQMLHNRYKRYLITESPHMYFTQVTDAWDVGHWDTTFYVFPQ